MPNEVGSLPPEALAMWGHFLWALLLVLGLLLVWSSLRERNRTSRPWLKGVYLFTVLLGVVCAGVPAGLFMVGWDLSLATGRSMSPTLSASNLLVIDTQSYRNHPPALGDVVSLVVASRGETLPLDKRVMGLPGDHIRYERGMFFINGLRLEVLPLDGGVADREPGSQPGRVRLGLKAFGVMAPFMGTHQRFDAIVPADHYFVVGDNWANSHDSRDFGAVPRSAIVGKVIHSWSTDRGWGAP